MAQIEVARFYQDISFDFDNLTSSGDLRSLENEHAVKNAVINIVTTMKREKLFKPYFGTNLLKLLFDPISFFILIGMKNQIMTALRNDEPRIIVQDVVVRFDDEYHLLLADIFYVIIGLNTYEQISVPLERIR